MTTTVVAAGPTRAPRRARAILDWIGSHQAVAALVLYVAIAAVLEKHALAHLDSVCACGAGSDPTQYMWAMVWWPHALLHGLNPLVTHEIWTDPGGFNLAAATATPAAALAAWPITALAGPVVSFNIVATLAPAISAWFAYRLCLYVTDSAPAAVLGGYLYGFSSYELAAMIGHLHLTITFAIPAAVLLTLKHIDGVITTRRYVGLGALVLGTQLLISSEVLLSLTCMAVVALVCGWAFSGPSARRRIVGSLPAMGGAYALMALVLSPYLYSELSGHAVAAGANYAADSLGSFVPTWVTRIGGHGFYAVSRSFPGNLSEQGTYLGVPLIAIVGAYAIRAWRTRTARILTAIAAVVAIWSLGDHFYIDGHRTIPLPWSLLWHVPLLDQLQTVRLAVYVSLLCAVAAALWLASPSRHRLWRWLLAASAVLVLLPNVALPYPGTSFSLYHTTVPTPSFFTNGLYKHYLRPNEIVLPLPYGFVTPYGYSLLWQARADMYFRIASGSFGYSPSVYDRPIVRELFGLPTAPITQATPALLHSFVIARHVSDVVADPAHSEPWLTILQQLGLRPISVGGVLVYRIPATW